MFYTKQEVMDYIEQEDVKFIRLAFCDVFGIQKNISVLASELQRAFDYGISFDASAIRGFGCDEKSDLFLFPDPSTLAVLPWRPSHGRVVRLFCDIKYPDGRSFEMDSRTILKNAIAYAEKKKFLFRFGSEFEFYLLRTDEDGSPTDLPFDNAGYMDIAPGDRGENVRREICLTLEEMGIIPESSHHEEGPGQNEIDFKYSDPLSSADNAMTFKAAVQAIAAQNGLSASFMPKPLKDYSGNGLHINISVKSADNEDHSMEVMAGIMSHIKEMTAFLNPVSESYQRLGKLKAPKYISWSPENRSQLIRIPAAKGEYKRIELRSPDPCANPYLAYALLIYAGLDGIAKHMSPPEPMNINLFTAPKEITDSLETLPSDLASALEYAAVSPFISSFIPENVIDTYCRCPR